MTETLTIQYGCDHPATPSAASFGEWITAACTELGESVDRELTLRVVDLAESQALNRDFRGKDAPTNVLAFPAAGENWPDGVTVPLGDIVICAPLVAEEAHVQGKEAVSHWCHLTLHGVLHLCGHDHTEQQAAEQMELIETRILEKFGIRDPYTPIAE